MWPFPGRVQASLRLLYIPRPGSCFPSLLCFVIRTGGVLLGVVIRSSSARLWLVRTADISRLLTTLLHVYTQYRKSYLFSLLEFGRYWSYQHYCMCFFFFYKEKEMWRSGKYALPAKDETIACWMVGTRCTKNTVNLTWGNESKDKEFSYFKFLSHKLRNFLVVEVYKG